MALKLGNRLIFIHDHACSCSDCGAASENETRKVRFDVKDGCQNHVQRAVRRMLHNWATIGTVLGPNPDSILRHLSPQLTPTTAAVLAFQHGRVVFARSLITTKLHEYKLRFELKSSSRKTHIVDGNLMSGKSSLSQPSSDSADSKLGWPFGLKGASQALMAAKEESGKVGSKSEIKSSASGWLFSTEAAAEKIASGLELSQAVAAHESALGWPLRRISAPKIQMTGHNSEMETAAALPERPASVSSTIYNSDESSIVSSSGSCYYENNNELCDSSPIEKLQKDIERVLTTKSSAIKIFSYTELQLATSHFSPGNLVGMGGSSSVYKGCILNGKLAAIKVFKSYKEAFEDFFTEMEITSSLRHRHIVPLAGVCLDQDRVISVYDLLPQGSLEEHLHGYKRKPGLPWEARFKVAVGIADALTHLHDECPHPVIHRDVTSSNILLSNDFQPQLSDFGLAMWGEKSEMTREVTKDVFGTFGYIAPEYFMHGKVSVKIDVYSYGVIVLELLSGRRPVNLKAQKGQESLVNWARQLVDGGDFSSLMDSKLGDKIDADQFVRMVLAAYLCTSQSAELRPNMSQILKLLKGEIDLKQLIESHQNRLNGCGQEEEAWGSHWSHCVLKFANDSPRAIRPKPRRRKSLADSLNDCNQRFKLADFLKQDH
uniref:Protein kinase domain-containing protein n=1 Tax=Kalanchoe fedtschenkoi TaxID=63787 RepID=A0A7N0V1K7_KALFE